MAIVHKFSEDSAMRSDNKTLVLLLKKYKSKQTVGSVTMALFERQNIHLMEPNR